MRPYIELKLSWHLFQKAPDALSSSERGRLARAAVTQAGIEERILRHPDAAGIVIPAATLEQRLAEIRQRYPDEEAYRQDLERLGFGEEAMATAIARDLRVEAMLEKIAAGIPPASPVEAEIFYRLRPEAFARPEARRLRHILVTFDTPAGKLAARRTLEGLRPRLRTPEDFAAAALRHSQCPTALQGGEMGVVKRGQLYPELEPGAFGLAAGRVSEVLESPVGLHLFRCDQVFPAGQMEFAQVRKRIMEKLTEQRRSQAQRDWLQSLPG